MEENNTTQEEIKTKDGETNPSYDDITIVSVRRTNLTNQACAEIIVPSINGNNPFGYFIDLAHDVDSRIHTFIRSKISSGEVEVLPPFLPQEEYDSVVLKSKAAQFLAETDHFMTIDSELSDDEIKEMKKYRKSLRTLSKSETKGLSDKDLPEMPRFIKLDCDRLVYTGSGEK